MEELWKLFAAENLIKSEDFLDKNSKDKDVLVTSSGLQYKILEKNTIRKRMEKKYRNT